MGETDPQLADITKAFADVGIDVMADAVAAEDLAVAIGEAWQRGADAIIVAGGDGTVNCAAQVAVENDIVIGVLPMGTFNHFARDLGMEPELLEAVRFLSDAEVTTVDVGEVNGRVFVNNASIGVYPKMVDERDDLRARRGWGKAQGSAGGDRSHPPRPAGSPLATDDRRRSGGSGRDTAAVRRQRVVR